MSDLYRIYGAELSPYSVKVRSYFRYKGIPHEWIVRNADSMADYQKFAKIPIIPLVVTPDDEGLQDSTPIIDRMESLFPDPKIHPEETTSHFVSILLEEFGDEWGNKWMFHLRWARDEDRLSAAGRIASTMAPPGDEGARLAIRAKVIERMIGRVHFVGSSEQTAPQIEATFKEAIQQLECHLYNRPYLFGGRPAYGDFGLWGQIYNAWTDPTGASWIESSAPNVLDWLHRMTWPRAEGEFESWADLAPTLEPFVARHVGAHFCPWTVANANAMASGGEAFTVELDGQAWTQTPQKYHAKSLVALREKYAAIADKSALDPVLEATGCLASLKA